MVHQTTQLDACRTILAADQYSSAFEIRYRQGRGEREKEREEERGGREGEGEGEGERAFGGRRRTTELIAHNGSQRRAKGRKERERRSPEASGGPARPPRHCRLPTSTKNLKKIEKTMKSPNKSHKKKRKKQQSKHLFRSRGGQSPSSGLHQPQWQRGSLISPPEASDGPFSLSLSFPPSTLLRLPSCAASSATLWRPSFPLPLPLLPSLHPPPASTKCSELSCPLEALFPSPSPPPSLPPPSFGFHHVQRARLPFGGPLSLSLSFPPPLFSSPVLPPPSLCVDLGPIWNGKRAYQIIPPTNQSGL